MILPHKLLLFLHAPNKSVVMDDTFESMASNGCLLTLSRKIWPYPNFCRTLWRHILTLEVNRDHRAFKSTLISVTHVVFRYRLSINSKIVFLWGSSDYVSVNSWYFCVEFHWFRCLSACISKLRTFSMVTTTQQADVCVKIVQKDVSSECYIGYASAL